MEGLWGTLLSGGIVGIISALTALFLLRDQRHKLSAEADKIRAEARKTDADTLEQVSGVVVTLIKPLQDRLVAVNLEMETLRSRIKDLEAEREEFLSRQEEADERIRALTAELEKARAELSQLKEENLFYRRILEENGISTCLLTSGGI